MSRRVPSSATSTDGKALMNDSLEMVLRTLAIGAGATMLMDAWAALLRRFGVASLDFALLGRWIGHLREGVWFHDRIASAAPIEGERALGWLAHYSIGIAFAGVLVGTFGLRWRARRRSGLRSSSGSSPCWRRSSSSSLRSASAWPRHARPRRSSTRPRASSRTSCTAWVSTWPRAPRPSSARAESA